MANYLNSPAVIICWYLMTAIAVTLWALNAQERRARLYRKAYELTLDPDYDQEDHEDYFFWTQKPEPEYNENVMFFFITAPMTLVLVISLEWYLYWMEVYFEEEAQKKGLDWNAELD